MHDKLSRLKSRLAILAIFLGVAVSVGSVSFAFASLNFTGTTVSGDSSIAIDGPSTISIGTASSTGVTIGNLAATSTFPGNVQMNGAVGIGAVVPAGAPPSSLAVAGNVYSGDPTVPRQLATLNALVNAQGGTSYILQSSDNGKVLTFNNASSVTLTVPTGLGAGFNCLVVQLGAGTVTPTASGTIINQRQGLTKTAGQYSIATLMSYAADTFILSGDLQ